MAKEKLTPETTDEIQATDAVEIQTEDREPVAPRTQTVVKKSGTGLSLLAILIALGVGGAGYYFGQQQVDEFQQKLTALEAQINNKTVVSAPAQDVKFDTTQLAQLESANKATQDKIAQVEELINAKSHELVGLQSQINKVSAQANAQQPTDWLFSEADFLLNNALRKLVLDNDVDTAVSLLKLADETLAKVNNSQSAAIRSAINQDLKQLLSVAGVDQNAVMQKLSQLANTVDELPVLDVNFGDDQNATKLSDSLSDWAENAEKSATSFLNHFIRISPKHGADRKELLAPNQDIYLRENIRLRLQLAIMAVPRQQNELYKQSLEAVASWIRSYFDTNAEVTQSFLKSVDELSEVSIYVDVPSQLQSLSMLDKYLNRTPLDVQKVEIEAEKAVETVQTFERNQHTITIHSCAPVPLWSLLPELSRRFPDNIISSKLTNMDEILQNVSSGNADIGILPQSCSDKNLLCIPYLKEQLYVCIPKEHKLAEHSQLSLPQLNGFNCLLRDEIGFWTNLVKSKMPASRFLIQTDESEFLELVKSSTLFCFSTNYASYPDEILNDRKRIPIVNDCANVEYWVVWKKGKTYRF